MCSTAPHSSFIILVALLFFQSRSAAFHFLQLMLWLCCRARYPPSFTQPAPHSHAPTSWSHPLPLPISWKSRDAPHYFCRHPYPYFFASEHRTILLSSFLPTLCPLCSLFTALHFALCPCFVCIPLIPNDTVIPSYRHTVTKTELSAMLKNS